MLRRQLFTLSGLCAPGTCWSYQNVAYDAASEVVEKASGRRYGDELKRQLFDPIGMTSASVDRAGLQSAQELGARAQRRAAPDRGQRRLLRRSRGGRGQQQHQGHGAVDAGADGRDARRAQPASCSRRSTRRASRRPTSAARMRKFLERLSDPQYGLGWRSYDLCRQPHRRAPRRGQRLSLADPVRPRAQERGGGAVEQQHQPARRARVRSDGHALPPAVPRLDGARQGRRGAPAPAAIEAIDASSGDRR